MILQTDIFGNFKRTVNIANLEKTATPGWEQAYEYTSYLSTRKYKKMFSDTVETILQTWSAAHTQQQEQLRKITHTSSTEIL